MVTGSLLNYLHNEDTTPRCSFSEYNDVRMTKILPKYCLVCGDPTNCYHYDVPSCSGCKTFFRRTVISGRNYGCKNNGNCSMKGKGRCRQCRFDRCVQIGMNPAGINLPKNLDLDVIIQHVETRKRALQTPAADVISLPSASTSPESTIGAPVSAVPVKMASIKLPQPMEFRDVDFLLFLETKVRKLRESSFNPSYLYTMKLKDFISMESELGKVDRYKGDTYWPITKQQKDVQRFLWLGQKPVVKHWLALDLFLNIDMAKMLPIYDQLQHDDKMPFIHNAVVSNALLTQSYYSHEMHSDVIVFPDGFRLLWLAKSNELSKIQNEIFIRMIQPLSRVNLTKEEYVLLKAMILCNSAGNNISDAGRQLLEKEAEHYSQTLLRYIQSIHGAAKGASRYAQVLAIMEAMAYFAERNREYQLMRVIRTSQVEPECQRRPPIFIVDESFQV